MKLIGRFAFAIVVLAFCSNAVHAQVWQLGGSTGISVRDGGGAVVWHNPQMMTAATHATLAVPVVAPTGVAAPASFGAALVNSATRYNVPPQLLAALIWQESHWRTDALSPKGAVGLAQLMPATALALGVDAHDPQANIDGGAHYLRLLINHYSGDVTRALAAYNAGFARVDRVGGVPAIRETRNYVAAILAQVTPVRAAQRLTQ